MAAANGLEIEKRYLLKKMPIAKCLEFLSITQYYTPEGRFRKQFAPLGKETYLKTNKKFITEGVNEETEVEVTESEFKEAIKTATKSISKTRGIIYNKHMKWEIDQFENGLIIAEVELENIAELDTVEIPDWLQEVLIMDITPFRQFSNFNLAEEIK